jgi:hypothetical protein
MRSTPALTALLLSAATVLAFVPVSSGAAGEKQLRRVQGNIGYQTSANAPFTPVFGRFDIPDDALAVTQTKSTAELIMPDSSIVALGENTRVQVGAFDNAAAGPGSTLVVNGGTLRFDVRRPAGGRANYHFVTATSQIAVRGTIGLLSLIGGNTTVVCVVCAADSVSVTVGAQTFALATGQVLTVGITGAVTTGPATAATLQTFTTSGLNPGPSGPAVTGAAGGTGSSALAIAAGVGAVAAGIAVSNNHTPSPSPLVPGVPNPTPSPTPTPSVTASPRPSPTPTASPTASPVPTPSPTPTIPGTVTVTGKTRAGSSAPVPPVPPAPHAAPPVTGPAATAPQPLLPQGLPHVSPRMTR